MGAVRPSRRTPTVSSTTRRAHMSAPRHLWFKSSYSSAQGDDCVEIAVTRRAVHIRDSKGVARPSFAVGRPKWVAFVRAATQGRDRGMVGDGGSGWAGCSWQLPGTAFALPGPPRDTERCRAPTSTH
ncbi:DUF397 domain-containing protein [Embleya sp. NPDC020886]|uniref:DUF397 domain-containing protein n=1 Tax=Embleya sp. NPDC020886 TaxID=3363980 RepID=UPI0037BA36D6